MRIVIAGGSGFLGRRLANDPIGSGDEVTVLTRDPTRAARITWVHVDDAVTGPLNMVAPEVPSQRELARAIGRAMHRPASFPVPEFLLRLVLWGQADIVLHGRVAVAGKARAAGYTFRFPTVASALDDVLHSNQRSR